MSENKDRSEGSKQHISGVPFLSHGDDWERETEKGAFNKLLRKIGIKKEGDEKPMENPNFLEQGEKKR